MNTVKKSGRLIVVVGPSGVGKDSLINAAKIHFQSNARVEFVQRIITRECDPASEVHDSLSEQEFEQQQHNGAFSVWWQANGLYYGLPASVHTKLDQGQLLVANGSRGAMPAIRQAFSMLSIVHVTANADVLAERLSRRSRESQAQIAQRLARNKAIEPLAGDDVITIDNSGARQSAIDEFIAVLAKYSV